MECGLRKTADLIKRAYPKACDVIKHDIYVDDCLPGDSTDENTLTITDNLKFALEQGGFTLKGFTFSGHDPPPHLTNNWESVTVGGIKWFPKGDFFFINCGELNSSKKCRGRKTHMNGVIPEHLSKRDCGGKVAEVFDPLGRVSPLVAGMKLNIHDSRDM